MVDGVVHDTIKDKPMIPISTTSRTADQACSELQAPEMAHRLESIATILWTDLRPVLGADGSPQARRVTAWMNKEGETAEGGRFSETALTAIVCDLVTLRNESLGFALGPDRAVKPRRAVPANDTGGAVALGAAVSRLITGIGKIDTEMAMRLATTALMLNETQRRDIAAQILARPGALNRF